MFGGWDTPVCFNDMFMLDLGKRGKTLFKTYYLYCTSYSLYFNLVSHCVMSYWGKIGNN